MRHCCNFDAYDIWYLKDDTTFTNKVVFIGNCPICKKNVVTLSQRNVKTNSFLTIKKIGEAAIEYQKKLKKEILYSKNEINKMRAKSKPFGWKYGINKEKTNKNGLTTVEQYSVDFEGNSELIKKFER